MSKNKEKRRMVTMEVTYRDVRKAWFALSALAQGNLRDGDKTYSPKLKMATNLKIKRMMGVMKPLVEQVQEEEKAILAKYPEWEKNPNDVPQEMDDELGEVYDAPCSVGCDRLNEADFDSVDTAPSVLIGVLVDLGVFFDDEEPAEEPETPPATTPVETPQG